MTNQAFFQLPADLPLSLVVQALPADERLFFPSEQGPVLAASKALTRTGWPLVKGRRLARAANHQYRLYAPDLAFGQLAQLLAELPWSELRWRQGDVFELAFETEPDKGLYLERAQALGAELMAGPFPSLEEPGLLIMDMDSTAIEGECIDEIAELAGCGAAVAEVTARAMRGELDFAQSLVERVARLEGTPAEVLEKVAENIRHTPGIRGLVARLQQAGWQTALVSGGFTFFAHRVQEQLALDWAEANVLEVIDGKLTGRVLGQIVDGQYKLEMLKRLRDQAGFKRDQVLALGDGANDLKMLAEAGLGIAYHGKPKVRLAAKGAIVRHDMHAVLALLESVHD
ncbi:phosphoserine phosphatase SerB [Gallaecimonas kandeliae]|uniref:phosphoserine phosphatase SerB n=1 Tax=Gallaecimonas kandeliae TaxID=3029055 RepID=UPI00264716F0|nr:phosphoserine phosphatase SerB [Gallaecimonas kandeliae]WKE64927.1 phosphoserine phosphatase SerB [Gallaecimonas kandeliae]